MAINSKIEIEINTLPVIGDFISFAFNYLGNDTTVVETYVTVRQGSNEITYGYGSEIDLILNNFIHAFNLDYNQTNLFDVGLYNNTLVITSLVESLTFSNHLGIGNATITNAAIVPELTHSISFEEVLIDKCDKVKVKVVASEIITSVTSPIVLTPNSNNFEFNYIKGSSFNLVYTDGTTTNIATVGTPEKLTISNVLTNNSPTGAVITILAIGEGLTYSLGGAFTSDNVFQSILQGNYTVRVRDAYGCELLQDLTVPEFTTISENRVPYVDIPSLNPLIFIEQKGGYDTVNNNFSKNYKRVKSEIKYPFSHKRTPNFTEQIQLHTSYEIVNVTIADCFNEESATIEKKSENLNFKETKQAVLFEYGNGLAGIYFNGIYPIWAEIGRSIYVENLSKYVFITSIKHDSFRNKKVLIFSDSFTGSDENTEVFTTYNKFDFEIYDVKFDYANFLNKDVHVIIDFIDSEFENKRFVSEPIQVRSSFVNSAEIKLKSKKNSTVFFSTGIWFNDILQYTSYSLPTSEVNAEQNKSYNQISLLSSSNYPISSFTFTNLSHRKARQLSEMYGLEIINIDGVKHTLSSRKGIEKVGNSQKFNFKIDLYELEEVSLHEEEEFKKEIIYKKGAFLNDGLGNLIMFNTNLVKL